MVVRTGLAHPFVRAMLVGDTELLGVLAEHPRSMDLLQTFGPGAQLRAVLPIWRRHGMARTDWPLDEQVLALQVLASGYVELSTRPGIGRPVAADVLDRVVPATVTALLGPDRGGEDDLRAASVEATHLLERSRRALLAEVVGPT